MKTKKIILSKIHTYEKRRSEIHEEHKKRKKALSVEYHKKVATLKKSLYEEHVKKTKSINGEYIKRVATIRKSLASYNTLYKDWDFRQRLLSVVHEHVCSFSRMENGTIRNLNFKKISPAEKLAISVFCKFVLENINFGITSNVINEFLGFETPATYRSASKIRLRFTRSFKEHPENSKTYAGFKRYFKDYHGEEDLQKEINKFPDTYIRARNRAKKIARS